MILIIEAAARAHLLSKHVQHKRKRREGCSDEAEDRKRPSAIEVHDGVDYHQWDDAGESQSRARNGSESGQGALRGIRVEEVGDEGDERHGAAPDVKPVADDGDHGGDRRDGRPADPE